MALQFRTYQNDVLFGEDYHNLRDFLIRLDSHNYPFGRWDWMITHSMLDPSGLPLRRARCEACLCRVVATVLLQHRV